ncbi:dihydroorotate oxidase A [Nitrosomonas eutropha]|uniref:quinone-dependent dihydroorotate dehydrogenase n=1 Tax=Nitrosomonas TaxID=914 RepID=UPI000895FB5A|nr:MULTISPECIES: quinone-dependent dihydroorotate dehydrogenase [Nitrosomonas]MXS79804.1 quinone-dependent dihydroorotate dehydrogenase [Nitrosomonas sp. GH22]SDW47565.1 dihydroorotate oxidase A [Nitrosomonas eutropha]
MTYTLLRPLLFLLDAETAHTLTLDTLGLLQKTGLLPNRTIYCTPVRAMGLDFPNPVGLAAGLDKNGAYISALARLGSGFIEVGTVTPRPQPGNPRPRLFRVPQAEAIINRMGFNNVGIDKLIENVRQADYQGILGINIGKNADTPLQNAVDDYLICLRKAYPYASYVTVNISSPNTKQLRQLQNETELEQLLGTLKTEQTRLSDQHGRYTPLAVKIAPDLESAQIEVIASLLLKHRMDAVIATNTTTARDGLEHLPHGDEQGGLSGAPLTERSTAVIRQLATHLQQAIPIIGAGGIMSPLDAQAKIEAGASLVQVYSGLIYRGPNLVSEITSLLCSRPPHAG